MHLGNVELGSQMTREQPTKLQATMKITGTPNLNNTISISQ